MAGIRDVIACEDRVIPRRKDKTPDGFDSESAFLEDMRGNYEWGYGFNEHNILAGKDDAKFAVGNQWDPYVEQHRKEHHKPVLTYDRIMAIVAQVVGNRLVNETEIRVFPDKAGTREIAEIRQGIIRSIFKNSNADFARDEAAKYQVICGEGYFSLAVEYVNDDVFEQEIKLKAVVDPYSVVLDPLSIEPTGADAQWGFIGDDIPQQEFKRRWPWAAEVSFLDEKNWNKNGFWLSQDCVRIVSYWRMVTDGTKTLALYRDGTIHDVSEMDESEYINFVEMRSDGTPYTREVSKRFARLYVCSGNAILEGPYDFPISSLPIYRVAGWELNDGEMTHRWGIVRHLKDPQRLHNYWRSTIAEQLIAAPRNKWLTTPNAVKGHEANWRKSPSSDNPFLYFNEDEMAPVHIPPPGIDAALMNEAGMATQDLKDISNIHEAAMGMPSNEVSKVAIQQRQMISDVGSFIYVDRRRLADQRCAKNIDELIPHIYDTQRTLVIMGQDDKELLAVINDPSNPNSDISLGKYGITVSIGPSSETKRALAREQMMAFVNAAPQAAGAAMDLVADAQDWPKKNEFVKRFKMMLPAGMIPPDEMTQEMQAVQQQTSQMQAMQQQLEQAQAQAELHALQAKAANDEARARLAEAQAYKAMMDAQSRARDVQGKNEDRESKAENQDFEQSMKALDQHNNLINEDRNFELQNQTTSPNPYGE